MTRAPDTAPRHRTLIATIGWSHDLLAPIERKLFRLLVLFAGGWTLDAAKAVCTLGDLDATVVVDTLDQLVDQSLVHMHEPWSRSIPPGGQDRKGVGGSGSDAKTSPRIETVPSSMPKTLSPMDWWNELHNRCMKPRPGVATAAGLGTCRPKSSIFWQPARNPLVPEEV